jgi:STE24 endopeptidase
MFSLLFYVIAGILLLDFAVELGLSLLNTRALERPVPGELQDLYPEDKYRESLDYQRHKSRFQRWSSLVSLLATLLFLSLGGFAWANELSGVFATGLFPQAQGSLFLVSHGLLFFAVIGILVWVLDLPFSWYATFVVEQKFGFNRMDVKTFWMDQFKGLLLGAILGGLVLGLVMWVYYRVGTYFWVYAWLLIAIVQLLLMMFYTSLIVPLFNKQVPLEDGPLRQAISEMARKTGFALDNIFVMDGSKRSTKANAYFSGLGPKKRIVLYDTLIQELTIPQIVSVLAHEIGHYKHKHVFRGAFAGILQVGLMLLLMSLCIQSPALPGALGIADAAGVPGLPPFHIGLVAFGLLYSPVSFGMGLFVYALSRRHEYQADLFASQHASGEELIGALKKLSSSNMSHLTPHPWYVFVHHSHPTLLQRMNALRRA